MRAPMNKAPRVVSGARPAGGLVLIFSSLLFATMAVFARNAAHAVSGAQVAFIRSAFGVAAVGLVSLRRPLVAHNRWGLFWRGLSGALAVYCYFIAIEHLPIGVATLLNYTMPVFTAIWGALFFRHRLQALGWLAMLLTMIGLTVVLRGQAPPGRLGFGVWELVGLTGAAVSGLSLILIAEVRKTDGSWEVFGAFSIGCLLVTTPNALAAWIWPDARTWLSLSAMGVAAVFAQVLLNYAMGYVSATLSGIVTQIVPVAALVFGWLFLDERFGLVTAAGVALTLAGGSLGAVLASRPPRLQRPEAGGG
jgi:drug/metabolite transporter (DMT)-like permease